jgi:hypothetical protein
MGHVSLDKPSETWPEMFHNMSYAIRGVSRAVAEPA